MTQNIGKPFKGVFMSETVSNLFIYTDPERCMGCHSCELACATAHSDYDLHGAVLGSVKLLSRNKVVSIENVTTTSQCVQCEAPCLEACPFDVITKEDIGMIKIDEPNCTGCKLCAKACPYDSITMMPLPPELQVIPGSKKKKKFVALKCDLCFDLIGEDGTINSACIKACPTKAISLVNDPALRTKNLTLTGYLA